VSTPTEGPIRTTPAAGALGAARDEARRRRAAGEASVVVDLAPGDYILDGPLQLDQRDSHTTWRASARGARLLGGARLTGFEPIRDDAVRARLPAEAKDHVLQVDLAAHGVTDLGEPTTGGLELFFDGEALTLARWPTEGFTKVTGLVGGDPVDVRGTKGDRTGRFFADPERLDAWAQESDPWVHGYWFWDWADERHRVTAIDAATGRIDVAEPYHRYGYRVGQWFYGYNLLCELSRPGEYYVDRETSILYLWPPAPVEGAEILVSTSTGLVEVEGATGVTFEGLAFEAARGTAVTLTSTTQCRVDSCSFRNLGSWAVRVAGGETTTVAGCHIESTGDGGVFLDGGDRPTLTPGGHVVEDCRIHGIGRINRMYQPAVQLVGVGHTCRHNHLHDMPHMAVQFAGNDHVIECNDIERVCTESNDAGAIYSGRDWTWRGTVIRYNRFRDIQGFEGRGCVGVYLDDMLCGTHVHGNLFWRVTRATMIGGGRDCLFENNVYVDCEPCVHLDARAMNWAAYHVDTTMKERLDAMPVDSALWRERYPELARIWEDEPAAPKGNLVRRNVCQRGAFDGVRDDARDYIDLADNLVADDVGFAGTPPESFALRPDSPAWDLGFEAIPEERIGPRR
jgi:hypothetical protein